MLTVRPWTWTLKSVKDYVMVSIGMPVAFPKESMLIACAAVSKVREGRALPHCNDQGPGFNQREASTLHARLGALTLILQCSSVISAQCSECQREEHQASAGERREEL